MVKEVRGISLRMGVHSNKAAWNEALDSAPGAYDLESPLSMWLRVTFIKRNNSTFNLIKNVVALW